MSDIDWINGPFKAEDFIICTVEPLNTADTEVAKLATMIVGQQYADRANQRLKEIIARLPKVYSVTLSNKTEQFWSSELEDHDTHYAFLIGPFPLEGEK